MMNDHHFSKTEEMVRCEDVIQSRANMTTDIANDRSIYRIASVHHIVVKTKQKT